MLDSKGPVEVHAEVLRTNERSARVFRALGWAARESDDSFTFTAAPKSR